MNLALLLALLRVTTGVSLEGSVRSMDANAPVAAAQIDVTASTMPDAYFHTITDSIGRYTLPSLAPGAYHLRVSRIGYDPCELDVFIASAPRVVVDIVLSPRPERLPELRVSAVLARGGGSQTATPAPSFGVGKERITGDALHSDPALASADVLQSLAARGGVVARDEAPTSLHVHGGAASENAVSIDGVPVFNPYHANGTLTALNPDVISSVSLDGGAPSASLGDATASVIGLTTAPVDSSRIGTQGAFGARSLREAVSGPLPSLGGTFLVAGRRSLDARLSDSPSGSIGGAVFGDLFARFTMPVRGGELEAFAFHSEDRLSFDAVTEAHGGNGAAHGTPAVRAVVPRNALMWNTGTDALRWQSGGATRWELRAWRTQFGATFDWARATALSNSLVDLGAAASASWTWHGARLNGGVDMHRYDVRYGIAQASDSAGLPLALAGAPTLVSAFGEAQWNAGERWSFSAGVRDALVAPASAGPEPRLSVQFAPVPALSFGLGYARMHQFVQSLRNEESLFDAVAGISLPAIAGSSFNGATVPASRADQLTASMDARLSSTIALSATAYARDVDGLVLVAPVTAQPFATTTFDVGSARARGLAVTLARTGERISGELGYSLTSVMQRVSGIAYTPSFGATQAVTLGVGVRVEPSTVLRIAVSAHSGAPTSLIGDHIEWTPYTPASGSGDLSGSPQHIVGALNGSQLPAYFRVDVGVRHDVQLRLLGRVSALTASVGLTNVFNRGNALGMLATPLASALRPLVLPPRSAIFGLEWKY